MFEKSDGSFEAEKYEEIQNEIQFLPFNLKRDIKKRFNEAKSKSIQRQEQEQDRWSLKRSSSDLIALIKKVNSFPNNGQMYHEYCVKIDKTLK